jgi:excisionase family DNA binding protein
MEEEILTIKDVAQFLKVKPVTIYKLLSLKKIPGVKISGAWRFQSGLILEWIDKDCTEEAQKNAIQRVC